ncbi:MAG: Hsp20/alpha crystallin family protein [Methanomassiliicoccaceae archaeon]|nr:Hsp20/alpha crystallin family protein [Methanomassiliicoccaceae archaeon]
MDTDDVWNDMFGGNFESMVKKMERMFSRIEEHPGSDVKTYGYTEYVDPDGKRHVREFGNSGGVREAAYDAAGGQLADVGLEGGMIRAVLEIPGVSKEDIVIEGTKNTLSVSIDTDRKKFARVLALPCDVDPNSAKAEYNNGILEVVLTPAVAPDPKTGIDVS